MDPSEKPADRRVRLGRRTEAARNLAGMTRVQLAAKLKTLGYSKYGKTKLGAMETGQQDITGPDIRAFADACGLPEAFWTVDFSQLVEPERHDDVRVLKAQVADLQDASLRALRAIEELRRRDRPEERPGDE